MAVTNAIKHGTARTIRIRGRPDVNGAASPSAMTPPVTKKFGSGHGLNNMHRAEALGGRVQFERGASQAALTLNLPLRLADR